MNVVKYFAVYDKAAAAFTPPFPARTNGEAIRMFMDAVGGKDHQFAKFPGDYSLHYVADFNESSGAFIPSDRGAEKIITALEIVGEELPRVA